eukprot:13511891-Alexandrium_andersonii.AAC.1
MSASLVGSEMCIRDRRSMRWTSAGSTVQQLAVPPAHLRRQSGCLGSVSYTHLTLPTICSV